MSEFIKTTSMGIVCPIIKEGDDLKQIVVNSLLQASKDNFEIQDRDVLAITESVVARAQGNYCTINDIKTDIERKYPDGIIGLVFPITSRNRFSICLKAIASGAKKIYLQLSYPTDEVGNQIMTVDQLDQFHINPYSDNLTLEQYRQYFGENLHPFIKVDYIAFYQELIQKQGCEVEIIFSNDCRHILNYTKNVLVCDIHTRQRTKRILKENNAEIVYGLDDIMSEPINNSGYNKQFGLLGSNKADEERIKLFPRDCQVFVDDIQKQLFDITGKKIEVMIYGDGAFKDPVGKIWELADPMVSPAYTVGLEGTPNELKLKYLADNEFKDLTGDQLRKAITEKISHKEDNLAGKMVSEGTTPRRLVDLLGSLADLTSGSGDKGTPVVYIQNYFSNYSK